MFVGHTFPMLVGCGSIRDIRYAFKLFSHSIFPIMPHCNPITAFFLVIFPSPPWICPPYLLNYPLVNKHNYGKSPFLMGKLTISMAVFQFAFCMFTRPGTVDIDGKIKHAWIVEIIFRKPMDFSRFWLWLTVRHGKSPNHKWMFIAKIIYFYGPSIPWLC